ncbi:MAG: DUF2807 domain-containing protein [Bacteroidota bacterium]|nr:DUF2807 domain-containing protein [Bacteroidota bacterium]
MKHFILLFVTFLSFGLSAQENDSIVNEEVPNSTSIIRDLAHFNAIEIGGSKIIVYLKQSDKESIEIKTKEKDFDKIITKVKNDVLKIDSKSSTAVDVYISFIDISSVISNHIGKVIGENIITTDSLFIKVNGASTIDLEISVRKLVTNVSGAAKLYLSGSAENHEMNVSGAAKFKSENLSTKITELKISGAGDAEISAVEEISGEISGAAKLEFRGDPITENLKVSGAAIIKGKGGMKKVVDENGDTIKIRIGKYKFNITEDDAEIDEDIDEENGEDGEDNKHHKKHNRGDKFHPWSGIDIGVTGYLNPENTFDVPQNYDIIDLNYKKSIGVGINLFEKDIPIFREYVQIATGLGLEINNYKFKNNTQLLVNPDSLSGIINTQKDYLKTKLTVTYLTLPLLLELNFAKDSEKAFHFAGGLLLAYNVGSKSKVVYMQNDKRQKEKVKDDFFTNAFRYGLTARIGYGNDIMLFANYSLQPLFDVSAAPELYPVTFGISILTD